MITLTYAGTERSLADWGFSLSSPVARHRNLAASTYSVYLAGADVADDPVIPFEGKVVIRRGRLGDAGGFTGGYVAFIGYQTGLQAACDGTSEGVAYTFSNAWYFLENCAYQQRYASYNNTTHSIGYFYSSKIQLFTRWDGPPATMQRITSGQQISDILGFIRDTFSAQSFGEPFLIGTIDPALDLPTYQTRELLCAAAILKCLELSPDVQCWWDYTTLSGSEPVPTVHFLSRASLTAKSLALKNGTDHLALRIVPRYDLVLRAVRIVYEITGSDNGQTWVRHSVDKYGPNGANNAADPDYGLRVLIQTIDLQGSATTSVSADIETQAVAAGTLAWWLEKHPELNSANITDLAISSVTITDANGNAVSLGAYPYELTNGAIADWMGLSQVGAIVSAKATYQQKVSGTAINSRKPTEKTLNVRLILTDGVTGTYTAPATALEGEAIPVGVAQSVYTSLSVLQYEGEDVRVQVQITNADGDGPLISLKHKLNLSNGRAAWASMGAQLQEITEHDGRGETSISFGPAKHISAGDLAAMFNFNRLRRYWYNPALRETAQFSGDSEVQLGKDLPRENSTSNTVSQAQDAVVAEVVV